MGVIKKRSLRLSAVLLTFLLMLSIVPQVAFGKAYDPRTGYQELDIRFWEDKEPEIGFYMNASSRYILETLEKPSMGSVGGEWAVMGLLRGMYAGHDYMNHVPDTYFEDYLGRIEQYVADKKGNLHRAKSTEWSRLILALTALGYDITDVAGYDFIEKLSSSYRFSYRQGINGPIWEIIAMNTGGYEFYPDSTNPDVNTFGKMIDYILSKEITQADGTVGGWSLFGNPDPDITGMALQALAPYYGDEKRYAASGAEASYEEFAAAVERGIYMLSVLQQENGAYAAFGNVNAESTVQVIVALTALGIDPLQEKVELKRIGKHVSFIQKGAVQDGVWTNNMIDALLTFWDDGSGSSPEIGGFKHVTTGNDGGGGSGHRVNAMATEQSLYGLIAYDRFKKGMNALYDMTDMKNGEYKNMAAKKHDANFHSNGEVQTNKVSPYALVQIPEGKNIQGKKFKAWNSKQDGSGTDYLPGEKLVMPEHDITLYAQYDNIEYNIHYETNGGTLIGDDIPKTYTIDDAEIPLPAAGQMEHEGYLFEGWYDNPSFEGERVTAIASGSYGDKTFYAKWVDESGANEEAAKEVEEMIAALPDIENVTLHDKEAIEGARAAYNNLTPPQQTFVANIQKLEALEAKLLELEQDLVNKEAAKKVEEMIQQLPEAANLKLEDKALVENARLAYDSLTEVQQSLVANVEKLVETEAKLKVLQEVADKEAAQAVEQIIAELPEVEELTLDHKTIVENARTAFYRLTASQQDLVANKAKLDETEAKMFELEQIEADKAAADIVEQMIAGLPNESEIHLDDKASVAKVRQAYDGLTEAQQKLVPNIEKLTSLETKLSQLEQEELDKQAAKKVETMIDMLPEVSQLSLNQKALVAEARKAYDQLTQVQQTLVANTNKLVALEAKLKELQIAAELADKEAAKKVEDMIHRLPKEADINLSDKESVITVRQAYNRLTETQKKLVSNVAQLSALESKIIILEQEAKNKEAAEIVENMIQELPDLDKLTVAHKEAVAAAREAYDYLTAEQRQYVSNMSKLEALEEKLTELEKENQAQDPENEGIVGSPAIKTAEDENKDKKRERPSGDHANAKQNQEYGKKKASNGAKKLPNTATNMFNLLIIGLVFIIAGIAIYFVRKKRSV
ncbi:InlB B-repeat-containing protein [Siminovitchia sp. FSL W7-1587]|uniref:InlB B-repeat-containing protein n=1 Tax=Siminovitchia sp. FSL W7-1587 TaxID=2954699 RepID=UPI0030D5951E